MNFSNNEPFLSSLQMKNMTIPKMTQASSHNTTNVLQYYEDLVLCYWLHIDHRTAHKLC